MKNIKELSDKQIMALTSEQLDKMVNLRMAENGIKILKMPIEPGYEDLPVKSDIGYSVEGFTHKFKDKDLADKLSKAIQSINIGHLFSETYQNSEYSNRYLKPLEDFYVTNIGVVKKEDYFSIETIGLFNEIKAKNKKTKEDYEYLVDEYNAEFEKGKEIRDEIYGTYQTVQQKYYDMDVLKRRYEEYLSLADNNAKVAMQFFKKAYKVNEEAEAYVVSGKVSDSLPVLETSVEG